MIISTKDGKIPYCQEKFPNISVSDEGNNNVIETSLTVNQVMKIGNLEIVFRGDNNKLIIGNIKIKTKVWCRFLNVPNIRCNGAEIKISDGTFFNGNVYLNTYEGKSINIGNDCLFAGGVNLRTSDAHTIYDISSLERINIAKDIFIGNHVWIGMDALLLKGSYIADDCVVGMKSIITKHFEETNCILAGSPAKIVKRKINWARGNQFDGGIWR
ncbi:Acetyltransferase (isoleucine patch superfamily) [Eubacterium oxidoreducens]|uniref:Acetyltransferase (Isoleucine patch superfamily) n=2 Tax=Eubacterium oxidoreducens TaxID=1732 RepID=A0A1G6CBP4_EUBOX|nr:Acetyltransferase (isoleucine patch superfamily) [Eubacterium oxidoreducens]